MSDWSSDYVIVGSSGAALIGIQFVVMTLIANGRRRPTSEALNAFATPTIVHLAGALTVSAIMSAPWRYAALAIGAAFPPSSTQLALFVIAAAALGLLLIGIHNAWDTVTHIVVPHEDAT